MNNSQIANEIIELRKNDLELRNRLIADGKLSAGYDAAMEEMHNNNAEVLDRIINHIGYPTVEKVGQEASNAAWLVIQHAIGQPAFMRKCRDLLEKAVHESKADPISLCYLTDRIAVLEGRAQLYGTQFDWDENGELSPNFYDDPERVDQRRLAVGLNSLREQTELIRKRAKAENQLPPEDLAIRNTLMMQWKIKAGWIK